MDLSTVMQSPDFLGRRSDASQLVGQKLNSIQKIPPYEKKGTSQRMLEGGIGGAVAGASVASLMGAGGGGGQQLSTPPPDIPGAYSNPNGTYGVNPDIASGDGMPGPSFGSRLSNFFSW